MESQFTNSNKIKSQDFFRYQFKSYYRGLKRKEKMFVLSFGGQFYTHTHAHIYTHTSTVHAHIQAHAVIYMDLYNPNFSHV